MVKCVRCNENCGTYEYKSIQVLRTTSGSTTGEREVVSRINLCDKCYAKYTHHMYKFLEAGYEM